MATDATQAKPTTPATPPAPPVSPPAAPPSRHLPPQVRWAAWCVAGGIVIVAPFFGIHWWSYRLSHSITEDAFVEAHIVNIAPQMVSGRIVRFLVEENDHVKEGQVLAEVEPVHYRDLV